MNNNNSKEKMTFTNIKISDDTHEHQDHYGIYIHIPFCIRKCIYCDFCSYPIGGLPQAADEAQNPETVNWENMENGARGEECIVSDYFADLCAEARIAVKNLAGKMADTVFIGGGTPSTVDPAHIAEVLDILSPVISEDAEITIEVNPGTVDREKLEAYRSFGINRISIGVQSFDDHELAFLGRIHTASEAQDAFNAARAAGFDNINIDLIFGFPGHTMGKWRATLDMAFELGPEHLSFYSLQIEEGTQLYRLFRAEEVDPVEEELDRELYHYALDRLWQAGYHHYEISNAARRGFECRHNLKYWSLTSYIGLGAAAHSFEASTPIRFSNPHDLKEYHECIEKKQATGLITSGACIEKLSDYDLMTDYLFTALRRTEGINLDDFYRLFAIDFEKSFGEKLLPYESSGLVEYTADGYFRFTNRGLDLTNMIIQELFS